MTFTGDAPVLSIAQPWATLCFTPVDCTHRCCDCGIPSLDGLGQHAPSCVVFQHQHVVKTIETRSWATKHRGRIWIASTANRPSHCMTAGDWHLTNDGDGVTRGCRAPLYDLGQWWDFPLGCILGSVVVTDCLPILGLDDELSVAWMPHIAPRRDGDLHHWHGDGDTYNNSTGRNQWHTSDITDQVPYGAFTPGRYGWLLTDPEPLAEPVPFKGGQGLTKRWAP